jgi:hypothetical protein
VKPLEARNQVRLGPARAFQLAINGMRYRPLRSGVTVAVFALAVAFLAHMISYSLLRHSIQAAALAELEQDRNLGEYLTRFGRADSPSAIRNQLALGNAPRIVEIQRFSAATPTELQTARRVAETLHRLAEALDRLPAAQRALVLADQTSADLVEGLDEPGAFESFADRIARSGARLPGPSVAELREMVAHSVPVMNAVVRRAAGGHARAVDVLNGRLRGVAVGDVAANPPANFTAMVRAAGFEFAEADTPRLAVFARERNDLTRIGALLLTPETRARVAREARIPVGDVSLQTMVAKVRSRRRAAWLAEILRDAGAPDTLDAERIRTIFRSHRHRARLTGAVADVVGTGGEPGMTTRTGLLLLLSFLVCAVGVANAMLMSVTERFTEIATMKCLGGLDGFIMGLFVFEAMVQGAVGGLLGGVLGLLLAGVRGLVEFGPLLNSASGSFGTVLLSVVGSALVGIVLAAVAAVGPAWVAARLSPMEAMRVE